MVGLSGSDLLATGRQLAIEFTSRSAGLRGSVGQRVGDEIYQRSRPVDCAIQKQEAVHLVLRVDVLDRDARVRELAGVGDTAVTQKVELRRQQECGGQAAQILGRERE